jgi:predicted  nucleic acid-binding Zn-ribbon protein
VTPSSFVAFLGSLHTAAPPIVRPFGALALVLGAAGLLLGCVLALRELQAGFLARRGLEAGILSPTARPGVLSVVSVIGSASAVRTILSPDAAWDFINARLHAHGESRRAVLRYLAYVPLLLGLCGTILGLAALVPRLGLDMATEAREALSGAFAGTLFGIVGSILASLGTLVFGVAFAQSSRAVEEYVHDRILPEIPERRIGVKIEEAMVAHISARAEAVAVAFEESLRPVATALEGSARSSADAAAQATEAFKQSVSVLQDAGNLRKAARDIGEKLGAIEGAAGMLKDAADLSKQAFDSAQRTVKDLRAAAGEVRGQTSELSEAVAGAGTAMSAQTREIAEAAASLKAAVAELGPEVHRVSDSFEGVARSVERRNDIEAQKIRAEQEKVSLLQGEVVALTEPVRQLATAVHRLEQELVGLRQVNEQFGDLAGEKIRAELRVRFDEFARSLGDVVNQLGSLLPQQAAQLELASRSVAEAVDGAARALHDSIRQAVVDLPDIKAAAAGVTQAVAQYTQQMESIRSELQRITKLDAGQPVLPGSGDTVFAGLEHAMRGMTYELQTMSADLHRLVQSLQAGTSGQPPSRRRWWPFRRWRRRGGGVT